MLSQKNMLDLKEAGKIGVIGLGLEQFGLTNTISSAVNNAVGGLIPGMSGYLNGFIPYFLAAGLYYMFLQPLMPF